GIECIQFPKEDYAAAYLMFRHLRDVFGKDSISKEDAIRLESVRQGAIFQQAAAASSAPEDFLRQVKASVTFDFDAPEADGRVLELVNKTNQFNLNGIRYTAADWQRQLSRPGALLVTISYQDKFGPLGKIAVIQGFQENDTLRVGTWVMSCRAFARR